MDGAAGTRNERSSRGSPASAGAAFELSQALFLILDLDRDAIVETVELLAQRRQRFLPRLELPAQLLRDRFGLPRDLGAQAVVQLGDAAAHALASLLRRGCDFLRELLAGNADSG